MLTAYYFECCRLGQRAQLQKAVILWVNFYGPNFNEFRGRIAPLVNPSVSGRASALQVACQEDIGAKQAQL